MLLFCYVRRGFAAVKLALDSIPDEAGDLARPYQRFDAL